MKKIVSIGILVVALFVSGSSVFAYHTSGQIYSIPTYSSFTYTSGCNVYRYDPYTRTSTFLYTTCQTQTYPTYNYSNQNYYYYPCNNNGYYYDSYCYNYSTYVPSPVTDWFPYYGGSYGDQRRYPHDDYYDNSYYSEYY